MPPSAQLAIATTSQQAEHFSCAVVASMRQAIVQVDCFIALADQGVDGGAWADRC
jgi:hypothetical protein